MGGWAMGYYDWSRARARARVRVQYFPSPTFGLEFGEERTLTLA